MEENLSDCNVNVVPMKTGNAFMISDVGAYEEEDLHNY